MSDMTALTDRLSALAAVDEVFVAGARVISQDGGPVALAAILREIDSTVLERTLVFGFGNEAFYGRGTVKKGEIGMVVKVYKI